MPHEPDGCVVGSIPTHARSFDGNESDVFSTAQFVIGEAVTPDATLTLIVKVAVDPAVSVPTCHTPVELLYDPIDALLLRNATPAGRTSVAVTPGMSTLPRLMTVTVYCTDVPLNGRG